MTLRDPRDQLMEKYRAGDISFGRLQEEFLRLDEAEDDYRRWESNLG